MPFSTHLVCSSVSHLKSNASRAHGRTTANEVQQMEESRYPLDDFSMAPDWSLHIHSFINSRVRWFESFGLPSQRHFCHRHPNRTGAELRLLLLFFFLLWCMQLCSSRVGKVLVLDRDALAYNSTTIMAFESRLSSTDTPRIGPRMEQHPRTLELASLQSIVYPAFQPDPNYCPVLQIHNVCAIVNAKTGIQHRLFLTDGHRIQRAVLARELNPMVESKLLDMKSGSIVRIRKYSLLKSVDHERKRLIKILDMEVQTANFDPIGRPLDFLTLPGQIAVGWNPQDWDELYRKYLDPNDGDPNDEDPDDGDPVDLDFEWEMGG